jgi:lytic murein transglycosylase
MRALLLIGLAGILLSAGCAAPPPPPVATATAVAPAPLITPPPPPPRPVPPPQTIPTQPIVPTDGADFATWLARMQDEANRRGISERTTAVLATLTPIEQVIQLDRRQTAPSSVFTSYRDRTVSAGRIAGGRARFVTQEQALRAVEAQTGVPGAILIAIWGKETSYGADTGRTPVLRALATLGHDGRRAALFQRELMAALALVDSGVMAPDARGSWAGAMGQPQFMPSSYQAYGVDQDGDGRVDLWSSLSDVFGSMANFLKIHGWRPGEGWGFAVQVPAGFNPAAHASTEVPRVCARALSRHSALRPVSFWRSLGFTPQRGNAMWPPDDVVMSLIQPDGADGPAYLTTLSYRALLDYNCSNFYALSVGILADAVAAPAVAPAVASLGRP